MSRGSDDLMLCTINTGELYNTHIALANAGASLKDWEKHVKHVAIPLYQREQKEPYFGLYLSDIEIVAKELKDYYDNHIKEF